MQLSVKAATKHVRIHRILDNMFGLLFPMMVMMLIAQFG
jgi:hypothetical protein